MDILIGKQGNQPFPITEASVSRQHALFHYDKASGKMFLQDNNSTNGIWLLCNDGTFRRLNGKVAVTPNTLVRLGAKVTFRIKELLVSKSTQKPVQEQKPVDISHLRRVYDTYTQNKLQLEAKTSNIMMWRMASLSLGSIFAVVLSMLIPKDFAGDVTISNIIKIIGSLIAIGLSWFIVDAKSKGLINRKAQNEQFFHKKYCCPKCGYHLGTKLYDNVLAEGRCPNNSCKCKFVGK